MRGLAILLETIGFKTAEQQHNIIRLLEIAGCFQKEKLQEALLKAGYEQKIIDHLLKANPYTVIRDEISENEIEKMHCWFINISQQLMDKTFVWPKEYEQELFNLSDYLTYSLRNTAEQKYDAVIILGQSKEEISDQSKKAEKFLKDKKIKSSSFYVPLQASDAKTILNDYLELLKKQIDYVSNASIPNVYKAIYFIAKTKRILIVSSFPNLLTHINEVKDFFNSNSTFLKPEFICIDRPRLSTTELIEQINLALMMREKIKNNESTSYFSAANLYNYGVNMGSYAFSLFTYPVSLGGNVVTTMQPWLPTFKK